MVDNKKIQKLLIDREKNNRQLAEYMGITPQALNKKIRGISKWTIDDADLVCDFLGVTDPVEKAGIFLI